MAAGSPHILLRLLLSSVVIRSKWRNSPAGTPWVERDCGLVLQVLCSSLTRATMLSSRVRGTCSACICGAPPVISSPWPQMDGSRPDRRPDQDAVCQSRIGQTELSCVDSAREGQVSHFLNRVRTQLKHQVIHLLFLLPYTHVLLPVIPLRHPRDQPGSGQVCVSAVRPAQPGQIWRLQ